MGLAAIDGLDAARSALDFFVTNKKLVGLNVIKNRSILR